MSTNPCFRRRLLTLGPTALLVATGSAFQARAAAMEFRPVMKFGLFHNGNVAVVGGATSDEVAALDFDFVWDRQTQTSTLSLSYSPSLVFYRTYDQFDYFGNTLVLDYSKEPSEDSRIKVQAYVQRTQQQGQTSALPDRATTFIPRSTQSLAVLAVDGTNPAGRRGFVDWQIRTGVDRYTEVEADTSASAPPPPPFNDSVWVRGNVGWQAALSERNRLGVGVGAGYFDYELTPDVVVASVGLVGTSQASPRWTINYAFGASRADSDTGAEDGFSFDITAEYSAGQSSTLQAGARQSYSPGIGLGGATQDLGAWVSYGFTRDSRGLFGNVLGGYWLRNTLETVTVTTEGDTQTLNFRGTIGWEFNRFVALEAAYAYVDQNASGGADPTLDTNYSSYGLYLRWAIRGR